MTESVFVRIWIGGRLKRSQSNELVRAIRRSKVYVGTPGWERVVCQPITIDGVFEGLSEGSLHLQDPAAPNGEMPLLTTTCRDLGLTYRLWREPTTDEGCVVKVWEHGMSKPLRLRGDPSDPFMSYVESLPIRFAINHLREGRLDEALSLLEQACPEIPEVPPLELIEQ